MQLPLESWGAPGCAEGFGGTTSSVVSGSISSVAIDLIDHSSIGVAACGWFYVFYAVVSQVVVFDFCEDRLLAF